MSDPLTGYCRLFWTPSKVTAMSDTPDDTPDDEIPEMPEEFGRLAQDSEFWVSADDIPADVDEDTE